MSEMSVWLTVSKNGARTEFVQGADPLELRRYVGVRVLDFVALVEDDIGPVPALEPAVLRNVTLVGRHADVKGNMSVSDRDLEPVAFGLLCVEAQGFEGWDPAFDFLQKQSG